MSDHVLGILIKKKKRSMKCRGIANSCSKSTGAFTRFASEPKEILLAIVFEKRVIRFYLLISSEMVALGLPRSYQSSQSF